VIARAYTAPRFYDLRRNREALAPKIRIRRGGPVLRDPSSIDSIVLHQTAAEYGASARQIRDAGGDRELALARRALRVACHAMAFRGGFFVASTPLRWHVNHGNGLNARSLGIEIDGLYSGLLDDPDTIPKREDLDTTWQRRSPTILTAQMIDTVTHALTWLVSSARAEGMPIRYLFAHRQSSATRRSDPGQAIWLAIAVDLAPLLGLEMLPDFVVGEGRPIPRAWDPSASADY
jgi:hypothetical protein